MFKLKLHDSHVMCLFSTCNKLLVAANSLAKSNKNKSSPQVFFHFYNKTMTLSIPPSLTYFSIFKLSDCIRRITLTISRHFKCSLGIALIYSIDLPEEVKLKLIIELTVTSTVQKLPGQAHHLYLFIGVQ